MTGFWANRAMKTVRRVVLHKGGKYVTIVTYGFLGFTSRYTSKAVSHVSSFTWTMYTKNVRMFRSILFRSMASTKLPKYVPSYNFQCSVVRQSYQSTERILLNVKGHRFRYQFNVEDGIFSNKPLFDRTIGQIRVI